MRWIASAVLVMTALAGCASPPAPASHAAAPSKILFLAPQGVDPAKDTAGFNALVRSVTQSFAGDLGPKLTRKGYRFENVLDQNPQYDAVQKLALYAVKNSASRVLVATVETEIIKGDTQLQLRAQFVEGVLIPATGAPTGFKTDKVMEKRYVLRSAKGDNPLTMNDLAEDYLKFLQGKGIVR